VIRVGGQIRDSVLDWGCVLGRDCCRIYVLDYVVVLTVSFSKLFVRLILRTNLIPTLARRFALMLRTVEGCEHENNVVVVEQDGAAVGSV